jgi:hypothetical protein
MGGSGSGNWHKQRNHSTVDSLPELFATNFKNPCGKVEATPRDEFNQRIITFRYIRNGQAVVLFPSYASESTSSDTLAPILHVVSTPCHFGGSRYWLLCPAPNCGRQVKSLFIDEHHTIACRKCLGLLYESQYGGKIEKRMTRLRAMHRKILRGGVNNFTIAMQTQQQFQSLIDDLRIIERVD